MMKATPKLIQLMSIQAIAIKKMSKNNRPNGKWEKVWVFVGLNVRREKTGGGREENTERKEN